MAHSQIAGRVGPNAVTQIRASLLAQGLDGTVLFDAAGIGSWWVSPPEEMIPQEEAARLHRAVRETMSPSAAHALLTDAGRRTADYLLAVRIPKPAQFVLRALPPRAASWLLLKAISANAWTFAGTGQFSWTSAGHAEVAIAGNPLVAGEASITPLCEWHAAVFERLFRELVSPKTTVIETACRASGGDACQFRIAWS